MQTCLVPYVLTAVPNMIFLPVLPHPTLMQLFSLWTGVPDIPSFTVNPKNFRKKKQTTKKHQHPNPRNPEPKMTRYMKQKHQLSLKKHPLSLSHTHLLLIKYPLIRFIILLLTHATVKMKSYNNNY